MSYSVEDIRSVLRMQTGTEHYWRVCPFKNAPVITDGVKIMIDMCEAYWLVNHISSYQVEKRFQKEEFQVWRLVMKEDNKATLTCDDGNGHILKKEEITYTDFPLPEGIKLYLSNGVLLLPSEY